jgi:hypothetical protein
MTDNEKKKSETHFSKVVNKFSKNGAVIGSYTIEFKAVDENKFIQITQDKSAFRDKPPVHRFITLDPNNQELKDVLTEVFNI